MRGQVAAALANTGRIGPFGGVTKMGCAFVQIVLVREQVSLAPLRIVKQ
jgi:hypothetical protein